ncbi:hypothetical protein GCM10018790_65560 [Kitasatospora xanthocidica]|uniref:hypothetical protein n=1 Tax=Kitasatospora xanthocidica TaxID=83382 RepID=UPI00167AF4EF|nr:hypothetical protein [Kitasatospora xanthocidica]GHF78453.1 hypothetical protein GCM10018790_65560 [Kitasatospora xanthocidica]
MELTARDKRWMGVVGLIGVGVATCYAVWGGESDYPLPYKRRDASVLRRIALADPSTRNTAVAADDRTITMEVSWSGCDYKPDLVVRESDEQVALLLERRDASGPDIGCEDGGVAGLKAVLRRPLGTRALTDALTGEPVPHAHA